MKLASLHILMTYQCTFECDHCFVWGSPFQSGTLTLTQIQQILEQAKEARVEWIYFEGGEPFLYYAVVLKGVQLAKLMGFRVGIVSNAYWANTVEDAIEWLRPLSGLIADLSVSSDLYHYSEMMSRQAQNAQEAARVLGVPIGVISVCQPEMVNAAQTSGQIPAGEGAAVMYRGRAVEKLVPRASRQPWEKFTECPHENLREPGRCHLDPLGNLHICQGVSLGNIFATSLKEICEEYNAEAHPVCGPLLAGGPAALVSEYSLPHEEAYADACHLCYEARLAMRERFPEILKPDQMYGCGTSFK
jgi:MoaA/NifB/PqqE/SkfB family radical SAM enzyme